MRRGIKALSLNFHTLGFVYVVKSMPTSHKYWIPIRSKLPIEYTCDVNISSGFLFCFGKVCVFSSQPNKHQHEYYAIFAATDTLPPPACHSLRQFNFSPSQTIASLIFICFSGCHSFILVHYILMMLFHRFNSVFDTSYYTQPQIIAIHFRGRVFYHILDKFMRRINKIVRYIYTISWNRDVPLLKDMDGALQRLIINVCNILVFHSTH